MTRGDDGGGREGSMNREEQEKERGQTEEEQGVVGLKYPVVGGRQGQQRGSLCRPSAFTDQHRGMTYCREQEIAEAQKSEACLVGLFVEQKFSYRRTLSSNDGSVGEEQIRWGGGEDRASCCNTEVLRKTNLSRQAMCPAIKPWTIPNFCWGSDHSYSLFSLV